MKIHGKELLRFYDRHSKWDDKIGSPVSAITGLIGEDLVLGLLQHYWESKGKHVEIDYNCKSKSNVGPRLDAWVSVGRKHYQVEVKNWSAHSVGGISIEEPKWPLHLAAAENLRRYAEEDRNLDAIWKVVAKMSHPSGEGDIGQPVLAFWSPVAVLGAKPAKMPCWFECPISTYAKKIPQKYQDHKFERISIFSASLYLRSLTDKTINIAMPRFENRFKKISSLLDLSSFSHT